MEFYCTIFVHWVFDMLYFPVCLHANDQIKNYKRAKRSRIASIPRGTLSNSFFSISQLEQDSHSKHTTWLDLQFILLVEFHETVKQEPISPTTTMCLQTSYNFFLKKRLCRNPNWEYIRENESILNPHTLGLIPSLYHRGFIFIHSKHLRFLNKIICKHFSNYNKN